MKPDFALRENASDLLKKTFMAELYRSFSLNFTSK